MDGGGELCAHLLVGQFSDDVLGDEFVFESVVYEVFRCYGLDFRGVFRIIRYTYHRCFDECRMGTVQQTSYLFCHSFFQTGIQAAVNSCISFVTADQSAYVVCVFRKV